MNRYQTFSLSKTVNGETFVFGLPYLKKEFFDYQGVFDNHLVRSFEEYRLDLISYIYYKNPEYWWVIALFNDVRNIFEYPKMGDIVKVPVDLESIKSKFKKIYVTKNDFVVKKTSGPIA
jgi:hypothetical protein